MIELIGLVSATILLAAWVGYPLAIAVLAAFRPLPRPSAPSRLPSVSVVIATREDVAAIRERVADCLASEYPAEQLEVVVALDGEASVEDVLSDASWAGSVTVVEADEPGGKASALNAGVRASRGGILVFTDTRQRFDQAAIGELVSVLGDPRIGTASGSLELSRGNRASSIAERYWRYERWLRECEARWDSTVGVTGAIFAVRRDAWKPLPAELILDDVYTPMRIVLEGERVTFVDTARAFETRLHTPLQEYRRKVRTFTGIVQLCRWLPAILLPWRNRIWAQFVCHKLLRLLTPYCTLGVGVWLAAIGLQRFGWPAVLAFGGLVMVASLAVLATRAVEQVGDSVVSLIAQGALLQVAIVVGTVNGLIGRWHVWRA